MEPALGQEPFARPSRVSAALKLQAGCSHLNRAIVFDGGRRRPVNH